MRVEIYSVRVNNRPPEFWGDGTFALEVEIPDDVKIIGCSPSSVGYELVFMREITEE